MIGDGPERSSNPGRTAREASAESTLLPHLDAAYTLARYLLRDADQAEDVVQDACVRALRFFADFRGGDGRTWLLAIVRNLCYTRLWQRRTRAVLVLFDEELHTASARRNPATDPERTHAERRASETVHAALDRLPASFREVIVL